MRERSLDGVQLVASLVRHDPELVSLWWTESLMHDIGAGLNPDQLVVIDTSECSAPRHRFWPSAPLCRLVLIRSIRRRVVPRTT
jgi:hypothetical protein